jgi:phospholipid transport system substrate-binding protein
MLIRRAFLIGLAAAFTSMPQGIRSASAQANSAAAFVQSSANRLLGAMKAAGTADSRRQAVMQIVDQTVDVDGIAKFCLGRFWRIATPQQQQDYLTLFHRSLTKSITARLGDYQDVTLAVGRSAPLNEDTAVDSTVTTSNKPPVKVQWVVASQGGAFKIVDVIAEGTSLRQTQRSDYTSFLDGHGGNVQALLDALKKQDQSQG